MNQNEQGIADAKGKFLKVVENGDTVDDAQWIPSRILLSNKRVIVATNEGKLSIPLSSINKISTGSDVDENASEIRVRYNQNVILLAPHDVTEFHRQMCIALLNQRPAHVLLPENLTDSDSNQGWQNAQIELTNKKLTIQAEGGIDVEIGLSAISEVLVGEEVINDESKQVFQIQYQSDEDTRDIYLSGDTMVCRLLETLILSDLSGQSEQDVSLGEVEQEVLVALYSGVSPFEIPELTGLTVEEVEDVFNELIERDVLNEVRQRREVTLTAEGQHLVNKAINEQ